MDTITYHIKGITISLKELFKGNFLIFFIPGIVLMSTFLWYQYYTSSLQDAMNLASDYSWLDTVYSWINSGVSKVFSVIDFIVEQIYIFLILTVLSPFNTLLGERLDTKLTGNKFETGLFRFINDFFRMLFVVITAILMEIACLLIYWIISWFIGIEIVDKIMYFCISAFFFGFSFYDFALERYGIKMYGTLNFAFAKPLTMILTGGLFLAIYNIPIVGIPISPVIAVMVSTIVYLYLTKKLPTERNQELKPTENE